MEKTPKIKKLITFTDIHHDMLRKIMDQDGLDSYSVAIGNIISNEIKTRYPLYEINLPVVKI